MPEPQLNGAYYGPSIPPPERKRYHRPGRGGDSCNPCGCLFSCLCNCVCQILCTLIVILGVIVLVLWLVLRPNKVKFYVDDASLVQFDHSATNNTLFYNLHFNVSIRNPNKRIGIYYDKIEASAFYKGHRFGTQDLSTFYQGHKNTTDLGGVVFRSQNIVQLDSSERSEYDNEKRDGVYDIDLKLYLKIRLKVWRVKTKKIKPTIECDLKVPQSNGGSSSKFERTRCHLDW